VRGVQAESNATRRSPPLAKRSCFVGRRAVVDLSKQLGKPATLLIELFELRGQQVGQRIGLAL
jgi:hypothetical protein